MALTCTVCANSDADAIGAALSGGASVRDVAGRYGLGRSSVHRHATGCMRLGPPAGRLRATIDRDALAEIAGDTLARARELLDAAEVRGDRRGTRDALVAVMRAVETASRVLPDPGPVTDPEVIALLTVLAHDVHDPAVRRVITAGLLDRGADDLADALAATWARPAAVLASTRQEINS